MARIVIGTKNVPTKYGRVEKIDLNNLSIQDDTELVLDQKDLNEINYKTREKEEEKKP